MLNIIIYSLIFNAPDCYVSESGLCVVLWCVHALLGSSDA